MFYKRKFYSFIVVVLVVAYGFLLNQEALAITDVNTNIIEHWMILRFKMPITTGINTYK